MSNPFALDFGSIQRLGEQRQQNELAWAQNALAERRALNEDARLGFEKENHPYQVRQLRTAAEGGEETLAATRALRQDLGIAAGASPAASRASDGSSAPPNYADKAKLIGSFVQQHILDETDPAAAAFKWKAMGSDPGFGPHLNKHGYANGDDWQGNARRLVQDMRREADGGSAVTPSGPPASASGPALTTGDGSQPLTNLASQYRMAQRKIASGVPAYVSAGEQELKLIEAQIKGGAQITTSGGVMPIPGSSEASARTKGLEKEAEAQQGNYLKAGEAAADSASLARKAREMRMLAPNAILGSGAEYELAARKIASRFGFTDPRIPATELLKSGLTQFVSAEAQKLKPVSASDIAFVERSIGGLSSDPASLPHILAAWETAAQRQKLFHDIEAESFVRDIPELGSRRGYPNKAAILEHVDKKIPSYVESVMGKDNQQGAATSDGVKKEGTDRLPSAVQTGPLTRDQLMALPDGPVLNGKFIKRGGQLVPVTGELGTTGNPHPSKGDVKWPGELAYENGKLYKRTPNMIVDRWEEVK